VAADETNVPRLAVDRRLGYRPLGRQVEYAHRVAQAEPIR